MLSMFTGKPLFGTLISLLYKGRPILGIIDQPILRERWQGLAGRQSTLNGTPIRTRPCPDVKLAYLYATTPHMFSGGCGLQFEMYAMLMNCLLAIVL
jgi:inositol-phosphate phosphatase/L-galactose 1-phosphate phosphatase/histidinol-phosphatase